jgi:non-ribosomal peptide synthetase component F
MHDDSRSPVGPGRIVTDLIQSWVTEHARRRPDATALVYRGHRLTYGALEETSNRLAHRLRVAGCVRGDRVCTLMPKSPAAIIGILGILKADCIVVPLDPASPAPRLAKVIERCDSRWILAAGSVALLLDALSTIPGFAAAHSIGWLGPYEGPSSVRPAFSLRDLAALPADPPACANTGRDTSHILFTSGSTGSAAGVAITHASVRRFIEWAVPYFGIVTGDRISGHSPLHLDLATFDIFGTFAAGAELHLVPPELSAVPQKLADFIRNSALTQWFSVPSALNTLAWAGVVLTPDFPALRRVIWCGEVLPTPTLIHWMRRVPHAKFTNLYGPTGTTIASGYYTVPKCPSGEDETMPVDRACPGEALLVLDESLRPATPADLSGVEAALRTLDAIHDCAVVSVSTLGLDGASLCCAYVAIDGIDARPAALRDALARVLPAHMLPARWMQFEVLPINGDGKTDRAKLEELFEPGFVTAL